jgi:hypothetical protein
MSRGLSGVSPDYFVLHPKPIPANGNDWICRADMIVRGVMKMTVAFWVSVALVGAFIFAEEVPPAFERAEKGPAAAAGEDFDPFDPVSSAPKVIRVQVEHIEMSHKDLTRLLMEDKSKTSDSTALRMKVHEMVEKDQAKVIDTQIAMGRSGAAQEAESRDEYIYPTEYDPPGSEKLMEELAKQGIHPQNPALPTAFETRSLGSSLEIEPTLGTDDKIIELRFVTGLVWHTGESVWYEGKDEAGNRFKATTPKIYILRTDADITCIPGQYMMVAALSPKNAVGKLDPERKVMVFVKCEVLPVVP